MPDESKPPQIFYGGEVIDYTFGDIPAVESEEEVKARKALEKERKKNPKQTSLLPINERDRAKFQKELPDIHVPTDEELINDLPF